MDKHDETGNNEKPWLATRTYTLYGTHCGCRKNGCVNLVCPCRQNERVCGEKCKCGPTCKNSAQYHENTDPGHLKERYPHAFGDAINYRYESPEKNLRLDVPDELITSVMEDLLSPEQPPLEQVLGLGEVVEVPDESKSEAEAEKERYALEKFALVAEVLLRRADIHRGKALQQEEAEQKMDESAAVSSSDAICRASTSLNEPAVTPASRSTDGDEEMEWSDRCSDDDEKSGTS